MTEAEIAERFIQAAETERKLPQVKGLRRSYGSYALPFVHTHADMNGWRSEGMKDQLLPEDRGHRAADRRSFWEGKSLRASSADVSAWEECLKWTIELVDDEQHRRSLWAWAAAKAGGRPFNAWCEDVERIHVETGRRRKDRAISRISCAVAGKPLQNNEMQGFGVLPEGGVAAYFEPTFEVAAQREPSRPSWKTDLSLRPVFDADNQDFSWAQKRNERRRILAEQKAAEQRQKDKAA